MENKLDRKITLAYLREAYRILHNLYLAPEDMREKNQAKKLIKEAVRLIANSDS